MLGSGRLRFRGRGVPQVLALVFYARKKNRRRVLVFIHQKHGKMYDFFEERQFYKSVACTDYLTTLGAGALIVEVEDNDV